MVSNPNHPAKNEVQPYITAYEQFAKDGASKNPIWIQSLRQKGIANFTELGFPTTRLEEWKYTPVAAITKLPFTPAQGRSTDELSPQDIQQLTFRGFKGHLLVFVNGRYSPKLSSCGAVPEKMKMCDLATAIETNPDALEPYLGRYARSDNDAFVALNTAFFRDGIFLRISPGQIVEEPIHLLFISVTRKAGTSIHPRNLIVAEPNSQVKIIEHYVALSPTAYFTNAVTEMIVGSGAKVEHCKIQSENLSAFHIATTQAHLDEASHVLSHSISLGARLARNNIHLVLDGEGVDCILNGLYQVGGDQLVDHHTVVDHTKPHCNSHEFYHGILDGHSKGVFNGKIFVRRDAQKTDAKQTNKNLLLSDEATIDTKPQLEIFADDVKCTHGATVGQLDEEAIFYLRSRGIGKEQARHILTLAFASDIIHRIQVEPVREQLKTVLARRLAQQPREREKESHV